VRVLAGVILLILIGLCFWVRHKRVPFPVNGIQESTYKVACSGIFFCRTLWSHERNAVE
jgi:hypothetical protein